MKLIAEGDRVEDLELYESLLAEGQTGEVRFYSERALSETDISIIENEILSQGVTLTAPITQDAGILLIKFKKEIAPLLIIALAVGGILTVGAGFLGWQLFAPSWLAPLGIPVWIWLAGGTAVLYLLFKKPAVKAAKAAGPAAITYIVTPGGRAVKTAAAVGKATRRK